MNFGHAPDIQKRIDKIIRKLGLGYLDEKRIRCFRSFGSKTKAQARIWSFPKIWQLALQKRPHYIIEIISEKFDKLDNDQQNKVLIHELLHIPKNFSGSLLPHKGRNRVINSKLINKLFKKISND